MGRPKRSLRWEWGNERTSWPWPGALQTDGRPDARRAVAGQSWKWHRDLLGQPDDKESGRFRCRRVSLGMDDAAVRCGAPARPKKRVQFI